MVRCAIMAQFKSWLLLCLSCYLAYSQRRTACSSSFSNNVVSYDTYTALTTTRSIIAARQKCAYAHCSTPSYAHINSIDAMALELHRVLHTPIDLRISGWQVHLSKNWSFTIDALSPLQRKCIDNDFSRRLLLVRQRLPSRYTLCDAFQCNNILQNYFNVNDVLDSVDYLLKEIHCEHLIYPYHCFYIIKHSERLRLTL